MIGIKLIGAILIITSSTLLGFYKSNGLKTRIEDLNILKKLIIMLKGEIRYARTPLPEALNHIGRKQTGTYKDFLLNLSKSMEDLEGIPFNELWIKNIDTYLIKTNLNNNDKEELKQLGNNLGYLDAQMQINTMDLYLSSLEIHIKELEIGYKEKSRLFNLLGIMGGVFVTIIII